MPAAAGSRCTPSRSARRKNPTDAFVILRQRGASVRAPLLRMIRKLSTGKYRLYSRKLDRKTGKRRNLGTFGTRAAAEKHERAVQYFKRH